jgi:hypothetical protein
MAGSFAQNRSIACGQKYASKTPDSTTRRYFGSLPSRRPARKRKIDAQFHARGRIDKVLKIPEGGTGAEAGNQNQTSNESKEGKKEKRKKKNKRARERQWL